jgi:large subunit ribosomal protein L18
LPVEARRSLAGSDTEDETMERIKEKRVRRRRRKARVRKRVFGRPERPRLTVSRSLKNFAAQVIDDTKGRTLVSASTLEADFRKSRAYGGNKDGAAELGKLLAERAAAAGIQQVSLDRNGYRYHGRLQAFAEAARKAGLKF